MDPPGTRTLVHEKSHNRGTWAPHGQEGCYLLQDMHGYRFLTYYIPKTDSERVLVTTYLLPAQKQLPILSPLDEVTHLAADLTEALQNPAPSIPILHLGEKILCH